MHQSFRDGFEKNAAPGPALSTLRTVPAKGLLPVNRQSQAVKMEKALGSHYKPMKPADTTWTNAAKSGQMPKFNPKPTPQPQA